MLGILPKKAGLFVCIVLGVVAPINGTGAVEHAQPETPTELATDAQLRTSVEDYRRTVIEGAAIGAATGAVLGAVFGKKGKKAETAAIGGAIGGLLGGAAGQQVADSKSKQITAEESLDQQIDATAQRNQKLTTIAETAQTLVNERRVTLAGLAEMEKSERRRFRRMVRGDVKTVEAAIETAQDDLAKLTSLKARYQNTPTAPKINEQIRISSANVDTLTQSKSALEEIVSSL